MRAIYKGVLIFNLHTLSIQAMEKVDHPFFLYSQEEGQELLPPMQEVHRSFSICGQEEDNSADREELLLSRQENGQSPSRNNQEEDVLTSIEELLTPLDIQQEKSIKRRRIGNTTAVPPNGLQAANQDLLEALKLIKKAVSDIEATAQLVQINRREQEGEESLETTPDNNNAVEGCAAEFETEDEVIEQSTNLLKREREIDQRDDTSQFSPGIRYIEDPRVDQNPISTIDCLKKAAQQGDIQARFNLGVIYYEGLGITPDHAQAFRYFMMAMLGGSAIAELKLGYLYFYGHGVTQNYDQALMYFKNAAQKGIAEAYIMLGKMRCEAPRIPLNFEQDKTHPTTAVPEGNNQSRDQLRQMLLRNNVTESSLATIEHLIPGISARQ